MGAPRAASGDTDGAAGPVTQLPREARDGVMRVWLEILRERHPGTSWAPVTQETAGHSDPPLSADAISEYAAA